MQWLFAFYAALLGAILGSFLNALLYRYGTGKGMGGRSRCLSCGRTLRAGELIPILSFVLLGGRCRGCRSRISPQYPLVEGAAALLSLGAYLAEPDLVSYALTLLFFLSFLFVAVYDMRHGVLPPEALALGSLAALASTALSCGGSCLVMPDLSMLAAGPLVALPLFCISVFSRGRAMGWGDSIVELAAGWKLGLSLGYSALFIAFWTGALAGLLLIFGPRVVPAASFARSLRRFTMASEMPFAPFLVLGAAAAYFFHVDLFSALEHF